MSANIFEVIAAEVATGPEPEMYLIAGECFSVSTNSPKSHHALCEASEHGELQAFRVLFAQFGKLFPCGTGFDDGRSASLVHEGIEVALKVKKIGIDLYRVLFSRVVR
jgi:hypothetical protein